MAYVQRWRDRAAPLRHGSMIALLVLFVMMVFVVPFVTASTSVAGRILQDVLLSLILLNGLITATDRSGEFALISLVALVALVVVWAGWLLPTVLTLAIRDEATLLALVLLGMVVGMRVFGPGAVTRDRIAGAVALYILVGVVWADAYYLVSLYVPGAFAGAVEGARASCFAIDWIESSARDISSRSASVNANLERRRCGGRIPPVSARIPCADEWFRSKSWANTLEGFALLPALPHQRFLGLGVINPASLLHLQHSHCLRSL
ncbi:hypothetical protein OKW43_000102 [Paraburkholderia sp. WC7.3g]